jgi:hypothetical protein
MKASIDIPHIQIPGEGSGRLSVTFHVSDGDTTARILFVDEWKMAREIELDSGELELVRDVLSTDAETMRKKGASLKLESDDLTFIISATNRGEPYRDGFDFNVEREWEGYPIFVEIDECRTFARAIGKMLKDAPSPAPSR